MNPRLSELMTIEQAAQALGLTRQGIHWLRRTGKLRAARVGTDGPWLILKTDIQARA